MALAEADVPIPSEVRANSAAIARLVRDDARPVGRLEWNPREAFELTRWSEPSADDVAGHRQRLFACICLLNAAAMPETEEYICSINETIIVLIDSLLTAFPERVPEAEAFFDALWSRFGWRCFRDEAPFARIGSLIVACARRQPDPEAISRRLDAVVATVEATAPEACLRWVERDGDWLLGFDTFTQRHALWRAHLASAESRLRTDARTGALADRLHDLIRRR